jgi:hypothetical protein
MLKHLYINKIIDKCDRCAYIRYEMSLWYCNHPNFIKNYPIRMELMKDDILKEKVFIEIPSWCPLNDHKAVMKES